MPLEKETQERMLSQMDAVRKDSYNKFMAQPITKLLISMIPPGQSPEVLQTLLTAAYEYGYGVAMASMTSQLVSTVIKHRED